MFWHGYVGSGMFTMMVVEQVLFWAAIIALIVIAVRAVTRWSGQHRESPEEVLARRFALGEISEDEYRQRLGQLRTRHS